MKRPLIGDLSMAFSYDEWLTFFDFFVEQLQLDRRLLQLIDQPFRMVICIARLNPCLSTVVSDFGQLLGRSNSLKNEVETVLVV